MTTRHPTGASRGAALAMLLLSLLLVPRMLAGPQTAILLLEAVGLVAGLVLAAGLWFTNSFESRLFAVVICGVVTLITVLGLTVGLPGEPAHEELSPDRLALLGSCLLAWVLIGLDARVRARRRGEARRPYAL